MASARRAEPAWVAFREHVVGHCEAVARRGDPDPWRWVASWDPECDRCATVCPVCEGMRGGAYLLLHFHGRTPRATVVCSLGCEPEEIARALDVGVVDGDVLVPRIRQQVREVPDGWATSYEGVR